MSGPEDMELSGPQRKALLEAGPRVLVAAAAGSGKTRLLVAHFVRALVEEGVPAERLIAVTFTRKAAAELVQRIGVQLKDRGRPDLVHSLDAATVGTIHSLCRRLLKDDPLRAEVDPTFSVLEAEAAVVVREGIREKIWTQAVEEADEIELEVLASQSDALRKEILPLYEKLRGAGQEHPRVVVTPGRPIEQVRAALTEAILAALAAGRALDRRSATLECDLCSLERCLAWVESSGTTQDAEDALRVSERFFPRKTPAMEPYFDPVRAALTLYRRGLAEARLRPVVAAMNDLLTRFHRAYEAYKRERGLLDFADLELRARALVVKGRGEGALGLLPDTRVMVDEFQDTNEVQCSILEGLGASRLLMVGDERQSIYRFRGADVDVFRRRRAVLSPPTGATAEGSVHHLDTNYRSRAEVLAFINRLFATPGFFGSGFAPLEHGRDEQATDPGAGRPAGPGPAGVEILAVERMEKAGPDARAPLMQEAEAEAVASRVRRLLDEEGWEQRDVVVLTPAQTHVDLYQQALLARGVDVYVVGGKGYYARDEVADLTSLLTLLLNTHDDLSLVTVLRSPLVGLSDDGLYLLGREARKARARSLWEVVRGGRIPGLGEVDRRLLLDLVERLAALRRRVGRPGLARLLDDAASECGYDLCVLASPEGKRRFANVRKLMRMADDFEALEGPDLAGFVGAIESMGDLSEKEGSAPTLAEGENVVRVMTVHQAKGLEFPLVVLAGLGSDAPRGARSQFVLGSDGRVGVFLKGSQRSTYESCDLSWGPGAEIATAEDEKEREEDIRLLYVAMTRAKERLLLVGAKPRDDRLKSCRIGRIALGLGLDGLPAGGDTVPLEGLDAIMVGVPAFAAAVEGTGPAGAGVSPVDAGAGPAEAGSSPRAAEGPETPCPRFVERVPIGAGPGHVSFSALAVYQRCPRQFYLERMLGLRLDRKAAPVYDGGPLTSFSEESDDESVSFTPDEAVLDDVESRAGREVGLLVHALLERHALDEKEPGTDLLRGEALEALHVAGASLPPGEVERALSLTQAFWRSPFAGDQDLLGATRETPFVFTQGELIVSGVMDLVWQVDDVWHIADYKTNALHGRTAAEVAAGYELQATVYSLAALRAGAQAVVMDFLFLEHPEAPVTLRFSRDDQTRLDGLLDQALGGLRRGDFSAVPGEECARCSVAEVCAGMVRPSGHGIQ